MTMNRIILPVAALAALILAACQPMPQNDAATTAQLAEAEAPQSIPALPEGADPALAAESSTQESEAACNARGGKLRRVGRLQSVQCVVSYPDAGQRCTDGDDCRGDCRVTGNGAVPAEGAAAVGQCQQTNMSFGCFTRVEDGKADATLCVD
jgi:putative hemolysin